MSDRSRSSIRYTTAPSVSAGFALCLLFTPALWAQNYSMSWFSIAGGGGTSASGPYTLSATIGQACAGPAMTGQSFVLNGGFWSALAPVTDLSPVLPSQANRTIDVLTTLLVTNMATSVRVPAGALTYVLLDSPGGASIDTNGVIRWTPTQAKGGTTNLIMTLASDNATPPLSATNSFLVIVRGLYAGIDLTDPTVATADPKGDGFPTLLKYALGLDPANPGDNSNGLMVSVLNSGPAHYLNLTFRQRRNALWLNYIPEVSGDQQNWFSDGAHARQMSSVPIDDQFDMVTIQDQTPIAPSNPRFIRLRVTSN